MVSKKTKKYMSPFLIINSPIDYPDNNFVVAGKNELATKVEGIVEAVEVLLRT